MKCAYALLFICQLMWLFACSGNDDDNNSTPVTPGPTNPIPEQITTYTTHTKQIIDQHCIMCHGAQPSQGAPMSLDTYMAVVQAKEERGLFDRISINNRNVMPPESAGGQLSENQILIIEDWIADGKLLDN